MSNLRRAIRALENIRDPAVLIPQVDGPPAKFKRSDLGKAYTNLYARGKAAYDGEEVPEPHPLLVAARNSPDPRWNQGMYAEDLPERGEDMSGENG